MTYPEWVRQQKVLGFLAAVAVIAMSVPLVLVAVNEFREWQKRQQHDPRRGAV